MQWGLSLPGGVLLTKTYGATPSTSWAYPNIHADIIATADGAGTCTGGVFQYNPYGQALDPTTGAYTDTPIPSTRRVVWTTGGSVNTSGRPNTLARWSRSRWAPEW